MLIGNQYNEHKIYRGIRHYDKMPLTSEDLHEYSDTEYSKKSYLMNNLLGFGILNSPEIVSSEEGIKFSEPIVTLIDGDIALIQSDDNTPIISRSEVTTEGEYALFIIGWYQHITINDTIRNYGGVRNSVLENNLDDNKLNMQISSRYQFRWVPIIQDKSALELEEISVSIEDRDKDGNLIVGSVSDINSLNKKDSVFILEKPDSMSYAVSDLYMIPIATFSYDGNNIIDTISFDKLNIGSNFIVRESEPIGRFSDGTTWYNPTTREFKVYVKESGGFVSNAAQMAFLQYHAIHTMDTEITESQNVEVPIDVSTFSEGDNLKVLYEGLELSEGLHYTVNYENKSITLLDFTVRVGDVVYFTVTRIVEANDITNVTEQFVNHLNSIGNGRNEGHLKLTNIINNSDTSKGVAATPKAVKDYVDNEVNKLKNSISRTKILQNITIESTSYVSDNTYEEYPFRATIADAEITSAMVPILTYSVLDAISGIHCPVAETVDGSLYLYASEKPQSSVHIESIVLKEGDE